ncbi:TetR/AcrR family transcriptional regulator [Promicromonospora sp. NPDC050249]|uniref:TetR/AcrR family transcriptional regulator n=1 Tax=Promicromonospora sp. NPDC050249 TaxID=3154743 RepID=UPI0033E01B95
MDAKTPQGVDLLWEQHGHAAAGSRPGLTRARIVEAAVELADAGGLDAVSMAKIAERLGFTTMSLYRHVRSKDEILLLMLDSVAAVPAELDEPCEDWRTGLERWCRAQWTMLRAHAWIVHVPISGPPTTPSQLTWTDRALGVLRDTGLGESEKAGVVLLMATYLHSTARLGAGLGEATSGDSVAAYSALLSSVVDAERFPALRRAVDAGAYDYPAGTAVEDQRLDYAFGLERILDGVEALIRQRTR